MSWSRSRTLHLDGTRLFVAPTAGGLWVVLDERDQSVALTDALPLGAAKSAAERIAKEQEAARG